jgi:septation ring formation regulator EzrA
MRNKELLVRRLERLQGELKKLRTSLNLLEIDKSKMILQEILELHQDISDIVEREN